MNFYKYHSSYDSYKWLCNRANMSVESLQDFYHKAMILIASMEKNDRDYITFNHAFAELSWYDRNKPYYNLHPALISPFNKNKLNFPAKYISLPYKVLVVQFPENHEDLKLPDSNYFLRSCMAILNDEFYDPKTKKLLTGEKRLIVWMDFGERQKLSNGTEEIIYAFKQLMWSGEETVEEALDKLPIHESFYCGLKIPLESVITCIKLLLSIAFLAKEKNQLVMPHVLKKDFELFEKSTDDIKVKLHQKAIKVRGQVGYLVGADRMFDVGFIGQPNTTDQSTQTDRQLKYAHLVTGHWQLIRYGQNKEFGKVQWIMPYTRGDGLPFKHNI